MEGERFWLLESVSDAQLRRSLSELLANSGRTEARIIAHLAEVEERRLHFRDGSESLYAYCINVLHLSNTEAFHRITAARIARRFPLVFTLLQKRALHLTAICLLRDYLTAENHRELLNAASHKSKSQVEELIARRFPRPDVESRIRKLPPPRATVSLAQALGSQALGSQPLGSQPLEPVVSDVAALSSAAVESNVPVPIAIAASEGQASTGRRDVPQPRPVEPLSEARYRIQLNASAALKQKLDRLRELTSHANPTGDIALTIERALEVAIKQAEGLRFARTSRPRRADDSRLAVSSVRSENTPLSTAAADRKLKLRQRKHVANAVVREVVAPTRSAAPMSVRMAAAVRRGLSCRSIMSGRGRAVGRIQLTIFACSVLHTSDSWPKKSSGLETWLSACRRDG